MIKVTKVSKNIKKYFSKSPDYKIRENMPMPLGTPPQASSIAVSKSMKKNIAKNTKPELLLRKAL